MSLVACSCCAAEGVLDQSDTSIGLSCDGVEAKHSKCPKCLAILGTLGEER